MSRKLESISLFSLALGLDLGLEEARGRIFFPFT